MSAAPYPRKKVTAVISLVAHSHVFEAMVTDLMPSVDLSVVLLHPAVTPFETLLRAKGISVHRFSFRTKWDYPLIIWRLVWMWLRDKPDVVHAHLFEGQIAGLTAAWISGVRERLYTRHNSDFHQRYFPGYVWLDRLCNRLSTRIVTISQATTRVLTEQEGVPASKLVAIPHGMELQRFADVSAGRVHAVRQRWGIRQQVPVIGAIARQMDWKGLDYVLKAFRKVLDRFPDAQLVMANATGPEHDRLNTLSSAFDTGQVIMIPFEEDVAALYQTFSVFVHIPIDPLCEAFGQTYVESLASGIPSVFTRSGIASDFVEHGVHAWVVPYADAAATTEGVVALLGDPLLVQRIRESGRAVVTKLFDHRIVNERLRQLYLGL